MQQASIFTSLHLHPIALSLLNILIFKSYSLYPAITLDSNYPFPKGQGEVLRSPKELSKISLSNDEMLYEGVPIEGLIFLKILPCRDLIPFLLSRQDDKSLSVCCRTCAENCNQNICKHNDEQRSIVGVYCINEIVFAVNHYGYKIMEIYEIYAFKERDLLFKDFMTFLGAEKIRHSKIPNGIKTYEEKKVYCDNINKKMNFDELIAITPENLDENEYQKQASKSGLNSVLGLFKIVADSNNTQTLNIFHFNFRET